jgi:hypothetical protein
MVQDVLHIDGPDDDDEAVIISPETTPGISPRPSYPSDDYFSQRPYGFSNDESSSVRQKRTGSVRAGSLSGSIMTTRQNSYSKRAGQRRRKPLERLHTEVLLRMVLHDAQTRLVFRAQALIRADVEYYVTKDEDLDYPNKLNGESSEINDIDERADRRCRC